MKGREQDSIWGRLATVSRHLSPSRSAIVSIALAIAAILLVMPPLLLNSPLTSVLIAAIAIWLAVVGIASGLGRMGWVAMVLALCAGLGSVPLAAVDPSRMSEIFVWSALAISTFALATPIAFAALGGVVTERGGVMNIGLEGMMLGGAFFAVYGADVTGGWIGGLLTGLLSGMVLGVLFAYLTIYLGANQIVAGVGINFLALGITGYMYIDHYGVDGTPVDLPAIPSITLPLGDLGALGSVFGNLNLMIWFCLLLALFLHWVLFHSSIGLRLRAVGENPSAAETAGLKVERTRAVAVIASGMFAALGGAYLSLGFVNGFNENMSAGRGFIALAAMIFGAWKPMGALAAALLFGFSSALALRVPDLSPAASALFQALPYVLTLIVVAGVMGKVAAPAAIGIPYRRRKQ